jgi:hypothetical protein
MLNSVLFQHAPKGLTSGQAQHVNQLSVIITKYRYNQLIRRKYIFWLMISEASIPDHVGTVERQNKATHLMVARKQRKGPGSHNLLQRHSSETLR